MKPILRYFPHLIELSDRLTPDLDDPTFSAAHFRLEMLPYSLSATHHSFVNGVAAQRDVIRRTTNGTKDSRTIVLRAADRAKLTFPIDSFLESACRTQNAVVPYLSRALSVGLRKSFREVMDRLAAGKIVLPKPFPAILKSYWDTNGRMLRDYRDLSQHFCVVSSDARVFIGSNGEPCLYLLLPNNPEVKNPAKLIYGNPRMHAYMYLRQQFFALIGFVYYVTRSLAARFPEQQNPNGTITMSLGTFVPREPITMGAGATMDGHRLFETSEIEKELQTVMTKYREICERNIDKLRRDSDGGEQGERS